MILAPLLFSPQLKVQAEDKVTLAFFQDTFIIRRGKDSETVPLKLPTEPPTLAAPFRKNNTYAVWDERGLTIRTGKKVRSTRLPDVALSPKVQTRDHIRETLKEIKAGYRSKNANALSGARRIGTHAYFLTRWEDKKGKPFLEALVEVNLTEKKPEPHLVGTFAGISTARDPIDDRLLLIKGQLASVVRKGDHWGLATYDPKTQKFDFAELGATLIGYRPINNKLGLFVERTEYGTRVAGRVDLIRRFRRDLVEKRAALKFLDSENPPLVIATEETGAVIHNGETGAEMDLPASASLRRAKAGLVVWSPGATPKEAWLYDPRAWAKTTSWKEGDDSATRPAGKPKLKSDGGFPRPRRDEKRKKEGGKE